MKSLPRLFTGSSDTDGIVMSTRLNRKQSDTLSFLKTKDLEFAGLNFILAQQISRSRPWRSHRHPGTDVVVTVRSSMNALIRGCRVPDRDTGHTTSADLTSIFIARVNRDTDIVQPVKMPFSR